MKLPCAFNVFRRRKLIAKGHPFIVQRVLVAGSFVTAKPEPNDFDCILVLEKETILPKDPKLFALMAEAPMEDLGRLREEVNRFVHELKPSVITQTASDH